MHLKSGLFCAAAVLCFACGLAVEAGAQVAAPREPVAGENGGIDVGSGHAASLVVGSAATTDGTVTTSTATQQIRHAAGGSTRGNEQGLFVSTDVASGHGGGEPYAVAGVYSRIQTADNNTSGLAAYDSAAFEGQALTKPGCSLCRVWGINTVAIVTPGTDSYAVAGEFEVQNLSSHDQSQIDQATTKLAGHFDSIGPGNITAFSSTSTSAAGKAHAGHIVRQGDVLAGGPAFGVESASSTDVESGMLAALWADGHISSSSFIRPGRVVFASVGTTDPSPEVGDQLVITDAPVCTANTRVSAGGGAGHACPSVYDGAGWVALVSR